VTVDTTPPTTGDELLGCCRMLDIGFTDPLVASGLDEAGAALGVELLPDTVETPFAAVLDAFCSAVPNVLVSVPTAPDTTPPTDEMVSPNWLNPSLVGLADVHSGHDVLPAVANALSVPEPPAVRSTGTDVVGADVEPGSEAVVRPGP